MEELKRFKERKKEALFLFGWTLGITGLMVTVGLEIMPKDIHTALMFIVPGIALFIGLTAICIAEWISIRKEYKQWENYMQEQADASGEY